MSASRQKNRNNLILPAVLLILVNPAVMIINGIWLFSPGSASPLEAPLGMLALIFQGFLALYGIYPGFTLWKCENRAAVPTEIYLVVLAGYGILLFVLGFCGLLPFFSIIPGAAWFFLCGGGCYAYLGRIRWITRFPVFHDITEDLLLLLLGAVLFALSFPNIISNWGFFPLGFVCLVPVFVVIRRAPWRLVWLYGLFFVLTGLSLYSYWLAWFHPLALSISMVTYGLYFVVLFPLLKLAVTLFPRSGYLLQALIWAGYEFIKTLGFLGYSYGILGYTQYLFTPLIQIADITGVWGVSLLVLVPSAFLAHLLKDGIRGAAAAFIRERAVAISYALVFCAVLAYGFSAQTDLSASKTWKVACIQPDTDPWKSGDAAYAYYLDRLMTLSDGALQENPNIVIWPETALVPSVRLHNKTRMNMERYTNVIKPFLEYMASKQVPFVLGNDDGELDPRMPDGRTHYNAALLMNGGQVKGVYHKVHLVPFTEYFPYRDLFPGVYDWLRKADTHFWQQGDAYTIFTQDNVDFAVPICFEDTFGSISREFVRAGAGVLINISNDAWSHSRVAEMQHMSMALFRAVENRRSLVRSTASGITCTIDPNGRIIAMLKPHTAGFLVSGIPITSVRFTLYTRWGDLWAVVIVCVSVIWLLVGLVMRLAAKFLKLKPKSN
jgi:apolipoprotein N-acyltransferase